MIITAHHNILTVTDDHRTTCTYDASGRLYSVNKDGWFIQRGLNGSMVARQWQNGHKQIRRCGSSECGALLEEALNNAKNISPNAEMKLDEEYDEDRVASWLTRIRAFDYESDDALYREAYRAPVGILPPDQYLPVVIQATEGCEWNHCAFCNFYKNQVFKKKDDNQLYTHIRDVKKFFGEGISMRNSIFLGEANCLVHEPGRIAAIINEIKRLLSDSMPDLRSMSAFMEPFGAADYISKNEFSLLKQAGLKCVYVGLETGDEELRAVMKKAGSVQTARRMIRLAKEGGLAVGIILLLGLGGKKHAEQHVASSLRVLRELLLDTSDMIFLSPMVKSETPAQYVEPDPLNCDEMAGQYTVFKQALPPGIRSSLYEIQGFIY